jgi:hypothetical protein
LERPLSKDKAFRESLQKGLDDKTIVILRLSPGILALLCLLAGLAPIDARWFFIAGMVLSVIGMAACYSRKFLIVLPLAMMAINLTAYIAWPKAIGFFPTNHGYSFGVGKRQPGLMSNERLKCQYTIKCYPQPMINEYVRIMVVGFKPSEFLYSGDDSVFHWQLEAGGEYLVGVRVGDVDISRLVRFDLEGVPSSPPIFNFESPAARSKNTTFTHLIILNGATYEIDNKTYTYIFIDGRNHRNEPKGDNIFVTMTGHNNMDTSTIIETTIGWHTLGLQAPGRRLFTTRFYAHPRIESKAEDLLSSPPFNRYANLLKIDLEKGENVTGK